MDISEEPDLALVADLLRKLKQLTVAELARRAEVNRPTLTIWLAGRKKVLSRERQERVCDRLGWRYGNLMSSRIHTWVIRERDDILDLQKAARLLFPQGSILRNSVAYDKVQDRKIGNLLFVVPPEGNIMLIRVRLDLPEALNKSLKLGKLLGAHGSLTYELRDDEYDKIWLKDELDLTPRDYLYWYHRDQDLSTGLDRDSTVWRNDLPVENPNEEEISFLAEEMVFPPCREITAADLEEEALAREDYNWRPLLRELQKRGISPQEVRKILEPHLELIDLRQKLARYEPR